MNPLSLLINLILGISSLILAFVAIILIIIGIFLSFTVIGLIIGVPLIIIGIIILILSIFIRGGKIKRFKVKERSSYIICKNCKNTNTINSKFCSKCGKNL
ncbi:MAG TPA: hypothetical protein VJH20_00620 [Candidatus Nanoarchaeia archaeon]|nr:hypothetical protein [Candidatus Nanoarchaeia archaeon]